MVNMNIQKIICFTLVLMSSVFSFNSEAASITVTTDRASVGLNESFTMVFESDGSVDDEPDFSPLNRDFQILSRNSSSNMSIVNGKISSSKKWQLTALARRAGQIPIPPISFGNDRSQASTINVSKGNSSSSSASANSDIFIEVEASPRKPYVQAEVIYTVRLFLSVATSNASLSEPGISGANAVIERLDEDSNYQTVRKGKRYNVVERKYAIYPQVSGSMTIEPVMFQGQMKRNSFSLFDDPFGSMGKPLVERSQSITMEVQAVADKFPSGYWIPAKNLRLSESWSQDPPQFQVGEPLTRTLTLVADGQTASQLLELPAWVPDDFKQYPDQAVLNDSKTSKGITATRQEKVAIIPNKAGVYVLPEISVPWWNTITDELEYARIPERKITVIGLDSSTKSGLPAMPVLQKPDSLEEDKFDDTAGINTINKETNSDTIFWQSLCAGLAFAWLVTLLLWWRSRKTTNQTTLPDNRTIRLKQLVKEVQSACKTAEADKVKQVLLLWAQMNWPDSPPTSLGEIGNRSSVELAEKIKQLNNILYSQRSEDWDGESFWQVFKNSDVLNQKKTKKQNSELEPLNRL